MHLLVDQLKQDGVISKAMFAMYLTDELSQSRVQFGGYDDSIVEKSIQEAGQQSTMISDSPDGIYWMEISSQSHWQVLLYNASFGTTNIKITTVDLIFDSGSSMMYFPRNEYI